MRRIVKKSIVCALVCAITAAAMIGCGSNSTPDTPAGKIDNNGGEDNPAQDDTAETPASGENAGAELGETSEYPAVGEMNESETDALGNPINDDGVYYDEDGNIVSAEDMENVDEDGNPISEEDMYYSEEEDEGWDSVEYGDKESFMQDVKTGYEEVTDIPFEVSDTLYMLYANSVYEIQYENDTDFLVFCKGRSEEEVNRLTVAYDKEEEVDINGQKVNIYSYGDDTYLALWSKEGYWYSIYMDAGCTKEAMVNMVASVK